VSLVSSNPICRYLLLRLIEGQPISAAVCSVSSSAAFLRAFHGSVSKLCGQKVVGGIGAAEFKAYRLVDFEM